MSQTWKTIRVFISSTFKDMQAERDHLVRYVFPKLREELLTYRIHLVDVDLRWGVTSDQDALGCLPRNDQRMPSSRFLCILGGRYGWVPDGKEMSITADESALRRA
jgi:nephrocystin-3